MEYKDLPSCYTTLEGTYAKEEYKEPVINHLKNQWLKSLKRPDMYGTAELHEFPQGIQDQIIEAIQKHKWILITGEAGSGKTHLAWAIVHALCREELVRLRNKTKIDTGMWPWFIKFPEFMVSAKEELDKPYDNREDALRTLTDYYTWAVLDDLGVEKMSPWVEERLYILFDTKWERNKPLVMTTNLTMEDIVARYGARIASRIRAKSVIISLGGQDVRSQLAV